MDAEQAASRPMMLQWPGQGVALVDPGKRWVFTDRVSMENIVGGWAFAEFLDRDAMGNYRHLRLSLETRQVLATVEAATEEARRKVAPYSFVDYGVRGFVTTQLADLVIATVGAMLDAGVAVERKDWSVERAARRAARQEAKSRVEGNGDEERG